MQQGPPQSSDVEEKVWLSGNHSLVLPCGHSVGPRAAS